jgi:hypothetical protein
MVIPQSRIARRLPVFPSGRQRDTLDGWVEVVSNVLKGGSVK